jgi:hypothetical protein
MRIHPTDEPEEVFEATKERSHRTVGGIEVVEYDQADGDQVGQASSGNEEAGPQEAEAVPAGSAAPGESRLGWLQQECSQLADKLDRAREQLDAQKKEHLRRTSKLVMQVNTLQAEVRERESRIEQLGATCDTLRRQLDQDADREARVLAGPIEHHHSETDQVSRLKARLEERGRALKIAREEVSALHREREEMARALAERTHQVAHLLEQVAQAEIQNGFGMDFRSSLRRLFHRYPGLATGSNGSDSWESQYEGVTTVALDSPVEDATPGAAGPEQTTGRDAGGTRPGTEPDASGTPDTGLQRFLLPVRTGTGRIYELTGARAYVGRGIAADVRLSHPSVSRLHGVLFCIGGATIVEDARSTNGTYVNGQRVDQVVLKDGDVVAFGSIEFRFRVALPDV